MSVDAAFRQMIRAEIETQLKPLQNVVAQLQQSTADLDTLRALANGLAPFAGLLGLQAAAPKRRGPKPGPRAAAGRPPKTAATAAASGERCGIIGCGNPARTKGYCSAHYQKLRMLIRTNRRPDAWIDFPSAQSVPDLVLPRGRAAVLARKKANG